MVIKAALASLVTAMLSSATTAPTANEAFACNLPYRDAMQTLAAFTVKEQKESVSLITFGPQTTVSFDVGQFQLFGASPTALTVQLSEPRANNPNGRMRAEFAAVLPRTPAVDDRIVASTEWITGICKNLRMCIRAESVEKARSLGSLELTRQPDSLTLTCRFEMSMRELES